MEDIDIPVKLFDEVSQNVGKMQLSPFSLLYVGENVSNALLKCCKHVCFENMYLLTQSFSILK